MKFARCAPLLLAALALGSISIMTLSGAGHAAGPLKLYPVSIYTPHYLDGDDPVQDGAPYTAVKGQTARIAFFLRPPEGQDIKLEADLSGGQGSAKGPHVTLYRGEYVHVEGNSNNGLCSCPAGESPEQTGAQRVCVRQVSGALPKGCPAPEEHAAIMRRVIRQAPFWIVDPLVVLRDGALSSVNGQGRKTLIVAEFTVPHDFPVGTHTLNMRVRHGDHVIGSSQQQVTVAGIQLSDFPKLDSVHWLSMAPRNLIARPENVSVSGHWGPPWWSDAHWTLIERGAKILHEMGNTMMFVPLFVRNPTEPEATPLIKTRCITGSTTAPVAGEPNFNDAVKGWRYAFDFGDFKHAIRLFDGLGFKRFDGAHLMAFGGELPTQLACDLYESANAPNPYKKGFVFMPRKTGSESEESYKFRREVLYPGSYLETFLPALRQELAALGVEGRYLQHVTDENSSGDNPAYKQAVALVRKHLPKAKIIDAISNSWDSYVNTVDYPVMNIMFYYKALKYSAALRQAKQGGLFYYNTGNPTPAVGPNRGLDEHLLNMRVYPWLAIEKNLSGYLYWASNEYRYPWKPTNERPQDWTPYRYSLGPTPSGAIQPAHPPGNNWFLYPTASGLTTSLRAVAYYEGVVDHWLFRNAQVRCKESPSVSCRTLGPAMQSILRNSEQLNDYSTNAADYEAARRSMVSIVSGNGDEPAREAGRGERSERRWRSMRPH